MRVDGFRRLWLWSPILFLFVACGGSSCSSCSGCGVEPIPGGFQGERLDNAAQVRLTSSGIQFLEDNADDLVGLFLPGGLEFAVPVTRTSVDAVVCTPDVTVCASGNCLLSGTVTSLDIEPVTDTNVIRATIRVELESRVCTARAPDGSCTASEAGSLDIQTRGGFLGACSGGIRAAIDTRRGSRTDVGLVAEIALDEETRAARAGYTKITVNSADLEPGRDLEDEDVELSGDGGLIGILADVLGGLLTGIIVDAIQDQVSGLIQGLLDDQLCTTSDPAGCPTGTEDRGGTCFFPGTDECVPLLLGVDGQGDLGQAFLGGFSPGAHAPGQYLLAAGGEGESVNEGVSVFMYGGFRSTDRSFTMSPSHNPCVPITTPPEIGPIPRAATFRGNTIPGGGASTHVGIGLAEGFLNHAAWGAFDGGLLCLGVGTSLSQQLSSGLFTILVGSLRNLTFPEGSAPIAIALRPQTAPVIEIGAGTETDALLNVTLEALEMDFYVWSTERYVRFMTFRSDLTLPINLRVEDGAIVPLIGEVGAANSSVSNNALLTEDPVALAGIIEDVISSFAGMITGSISPFALPSIMGFDLEVPEGGIVGFEEGGEEFMGIFANLALSAAPIRAPADTRLEATDLTIDSPEALALETWGEGELPYVHLFLDGAGGPGGAEYEYSYRIDGMQWSEWTRERHVILQDRVLLFQARHEIEARARVAGEPGSEDPTPARAELLVDVLAPEVRLERTERGLVLTAEDLLSETSAMRYRFWTSGHEPGAWRPLEDDTVLPVPVDGTQVHAEVEDEAGNVGFTQSAIIRGRPNPGGGGCACHAPGSPDRGPSGALLFGLLLGAGLLLRRRRSQRRASRRGSRAPWPLFLLALTLAVGGCDCGGGGGTGDGGVDGGGGAECGMETCMPTEPAGNLCCEAMQTCVDYNLADLCMPGFRCPSASAISVDDSCNLSCECEMLPPLSPGLLATHLDMVSLDDGSLFFSGYSPGTPPGGQYGDLVVGPWDAASGTVAWEIVDGAPSEPIAADPSGWRGGVSEPGDDVGRWTSIAASGDNLFVSYYDRTHGALKLATRNGGTWSTQTVDDTGDAGRYSSIVLDAAGNPVIAYNVIEPPAAVPGQPVSHTRVATGSGGFDPGSWTTFDVHTAEIPCRPSSCPDGAACLESGSCVNETADCGECGSGTTCVSGTCEASLPSNYVEDMPVSTGLYTDIERTSSGLALVWYDRNGGNIHGASHDGAAWGPPFLIDGFGRENPDIGDSGIGASLFVDAADVWHVSYVDGGEELVRYARVEGASVTPETVDDGSTDGADRHPDGRHIVGDDSSVVVTAGGELRVVYQDATAQRAMVATRPASGGEWAVRILDADDHTGFWLVQRLVGSTSYIGTWWRRESRDSKANGVRVHVVE